MKKRILTKALSAMLCGTAIVQTGLSMTPPIMAHAETPDENGVLITNPMQTVSFYDMFGEPYDTKFPIRYEIWEMDGNEMKKKVSGPWNASPNNNYKVITDYLRKTNERGELIKYMVRPIPENPFEVDYDKTTETHLALKIQKRYSDKIIKVEFRQRNGKYLVPHQVGSNRVRLTPLLNKPDEKIKPVEIDVIGNHPYQLRERDAIFTTDRYGNPLKYDIDLIDYYSDLNYEYYMSTKTLPSMYATISGDDTVPTTPFVDKDGNFVVINVRKNERNYQDFWVNWINNNEYNNLQEIHNNIRVNFTADRGPAIPETTLKNTLHDYPFRNAVILPGFTEDTDLPITYTPSVRNISGYQVYLHRDQQGGESFNETGSYHARKFRNVIQIYKKVNNIKIYLRDYNGIAKLNADPKIKKITARIKKDGVTLQELTLQRYGGSSDYIDYIDEDKVPMEDGSGNIINYDLEVDMPEGYEDGRIASDQPAHQPGNKFRAILKRKLVPLNKTIKLNFVPGTKLPETNITAVIKKDGEIKDTIILNQVNNWTATSSNTTPLYDTEDNKINYTIEIQKPAGYTISEPVITDTLNTYTLTKGEPKLSGNISVKFEDYNGNKKTGNESYLPENVNISFVSRDGSQGNGNITLNKDSGYTYDISALPKEKPDGDDYDYVLTAPKITGYDNPVINGYEVTYKRTKETIGNSEAPLKAYFKKYDTTSDDALTAKTIANPDVDSVTVRLKNGETVTLTKDAGYTLNLAGKPKYDTNDNVIDYSVDHVDAPNGYELLKIEGNKDIVLKAVPEHYTTNVSANFKAYNDNAFTGNTKDNIEITIFRTTNAIDNNNFDGVTGEEVKKVTLTKDNGYTIQLTDLPKKNPDGEAYHYFIKTGDVTGFEKTYVKTEADGNLNLSVTHKRIKELLGADEKPVKVYFKKYDTTADDALTAKTIANPDVNSVTVRLKNGETVTLTKDAGYTLNLTGKPKYDTNDNIIDYSVDTVDAPNGYELLKIKDNKDVVLRAIPEHYTTTISTNFKSYNDNPFKGSTEDYVYVTVFRTTANITDNNFDEMTGEEVKKVMLSKSDGYSVTLTDLPKTNPDGEAYHYFIKMDNITGFEKTYTKNEIDGNLTLGVTHKRTKLFTSRKIKIKFVNKDGSVIACNPIHKIKITIYRNGDKLEEKDVTITNAETDIILTGLLYHEEESNYNGRLYNYEIEPSEEEGFNVVKDIIDDGFSSHIITYTSVKKLDTPCTDLTPTEPIDEPTPPKKEVIPWTDLVPATPINPADPEPTVPEKEVIPWTDLVPATPIKPDTPGAPTEPKKESIPWTDLVPATPINDNTPVLPVIPTVPEVITKPLIPVLQPVTEVITKPAIVTDSGIVAPVEPKVTTESGVGVVPDTPVTKDDTNNTGGKQEKPKHEPDEQIKTPNKTIGVNHETDPIGSAKLKKLKELQRKKELRERLNRTKIRKTLPKTGGTNIYYSIVPGSILLLSAMGLMLKSKKKK